MRKLSTLLVVALLSLFISTSSYPQFRLSLGPNVGLNFNLHTGSDLTESGNGLGMVAGAQVDMMFTRSIGLLTNIQFYDNRYGSISSTQTDPNQGYEYTVDIMSEIAYFQIEPLFKLMLPSGGLFFYGGPAIGFSVEGTREIEQTMLSENWVWQNNQKVVKSKASIKDMNVRFELKVGAGYDILIGSDMAITPQVSFGYGLTNVIKDVSYKVLTFQGMVTYKFHII